MQPAAQDEPAEPAAPSPDGAGRNLPIAIVTGLALVGVFFGTLYWRPAAFFILVAVVLLIAQYEFYAALSKRGYRPATMLGLAAGAVLLAGAYWRGPQALS